MDPTPVPFSPEEVSASIRATLLDLAPPEPWRRFVPAWLCSLIWPGFAVKYDAFLSYSWKSDKDVAPVIQAVIQQFLCPWYRVRAKTIFRDLFCLPASSSLEIELFDRLDRSTHLVVLACPEAAQSVGMEMEARHWFSRHRDGHVLIVVTAGTCGTWGELRDRLLPRSIGANLTAPPLWVSLEHRRTEILENPNSHRLRGELIEDLRQIILRFYPTSDWGQLRGEERSQRRRAIGLVSGFALFLLVLAAAAVWFALYAETQRSVAESRALSVQAEQMMARDRHASFDLAIRGWHRAKTREANLALSQAFPQLLTRLGGRGNNVAITAFSPDGKLIVIVSRDNTTRVWSVSNGRLLATLTRSVARIVHAAFSPDGQRILTASYDNSARLWDAANGRLLVTLEGHMGSVYLAEFSPDGQRIASTGESHETINVWNLANGRIVATLPGAGFVSHVKFSPDGQRVLAAGETGLVWSADTGQLLVRLDGHKETV
jgi:hypothetical protein